MLKKVIPVIFLVMMLFSVSASAETDIETLGKKFFQDMDFSESYLADVKNAVDAQDYNAAFSAYKKIVFDRILKYGDDGVFTVEMSQKDTEKGEKLYNENTFTFVNRTYIETEHYFGEPGSYLWIVGGDYNDGDRNALINDMEWAANLMQCYLESGDTKYLDRWLLIWDDYSLNYRNRETDEEQEAADRMAKWGLTIERRFIARQAPIYQSLKYNYNEFFEHFDNQYFAHYIDQTIEEAIDNDAWTNSTANQLLATLIARIKLYSLMPEITILKESFEETGRSFTDYYLASMFLKDGMDKEMSFNYNYGVIRNFYGIKTLLQAIDEEPAWFEGQMDKATLRLRNMASTIMPQKILPNIAENYSKYSAYENFNTYKGMLAEDEKIVEQILDNYWGDGSLGTPAFESIAFPYVGYYIMRDNWTEDSQYIFFRSDRYSVGHNDMGMLQVMYSDLGERLLIDSGPTSYGELPIGNYLVTSAAHNTIMVDGYGQVFHRYEDSLGFRTSLDFEEPVDGIWHTSEKFDFAEAEYTKDYGVLMNIWDQVKSVTDVTHKRRILMDKDNNIAVVLDEVNSDNSHEFQQQWNLAYKFNDYGLVYADKEKKHWKTTLDDGKAGVEIFTYTDKDIAYEIACGEDDDDYTKGWYLYEYGIDIKPNVHIETKWKSSGKQNVISLINATKDNKSKIRCSEAINDGDGFLVRLTDGTQLTFVSGEDEKNIVSYEGIDMKAKLFYASKKPDGTMSGIAIGAVAVKYNGEDAGVEKYIQDFEFEVKNGVFSIKETLKKPSTFEWRECGRGLVPYYGYEETTRSDYVEY